MTYTGAAVAYWVTAYNAQVALLTTRTSERDLARSQLYVSGTYQSGQTWQAKDAVDLAAFSAEVIAYNIMVADRDTWQARANTAYASGVWGSGESWQAAYTRVLPPASAVITVGTTVNTSFASAETVMMRATADRNGTYYASYWGHFTGGGGPGDHADCNIFANGVLQTGRTTNDLSGQFTVADFAGPFTLNTGQACEARLSKSNIDVETVTVQAFQLVFLPTQTNPH